MIAAAVLLAGCTSIEFAHDWWLTDPLDKAFRKQRKTTYKNHRDTAQLAWNEFLTANPGCNASQDFEHGFVDGFTDHMNLGGIGEPPYLPPRHYRSGRHESPDGEQAILDWFCGFRTGASDAINRGLGPRPMAYPNSQCVPTVHGGHLGQPQSTEEIILVQPNVYFDG